MARNKPSLASMEEAIRNYLASGILREGLSPEYHALEIVKIIERRPPLTAEIIRHIPTEEEVMTHEECREVIAMLRDSKAEVMSQRDELLQASRAFVDLINSASEMYQSQQLDWLRDTPSYAKLRAVIKAIEDDTVEATSPTGANQQ